MPVLNSIRKRSTLLLVAVGGALVLFVVGDLLTSNQSFTDDSRYVGSIDGEKIAIEFYNNELQKAEENYLANSGQTGLDENMSDMLRNQTWNQLVRDAVMKKQLDEIGIDVSSEELYDMVTGKNPHSSVKQAFTNPQTGAFDPAQVINFLKGMDQDETGATKARWLAFEAAIKKDQIETKYNNAIKKGLYVPTRLAKEDYTSKNDFATVKYIVKRYASIPDSTIKVDNSELEKYYKANINDFKVAEDSRKIEYVSFDVNPSEQDIADLQNEMTALKGEFATTTSDSLFVSLNSESKYISDFTGKGSLPESIDSLLFKASKGEVFGPYEENGFLKIAKLIDTKQIPDSAKARHILIKPVNNDLAKAKSKADSLLALIKKGAKFADLASNNSEDFGSATKGGDLGWFKPGTMVKPFNDACFEGKKGDLTIVESQFGVHLIEVQDLGKPSTKVKVAVVDKEIEASQKTYDLFYSKASEFASKAKDIESFEATAKELNLIRKPVETLKEKDRIIPGVNGTREVVRWAFKSDKDKVSPAYEGEKTFIVACLYEIKEKGYATLAQVKQQVEIGAIKDKKAAMFMEEFKNASGATIEEVAQKLGLTVETSANFTLSSVTLQTVGREPNVGGAVFSDAATGKVFGPIKGAAGVLMISTVEIKKAVEPQDLKTNKTQVASSIESRAGYEVYNALKEKIEVEDRLGKIF